MTMIDVYILGRMASFGDFLTVFGFLCTLACFGVGFVFVLECDFSLEKISEALEIYKRRVKVFKICLIVSLLMSICGGLIPSKGNLYEMFLIPKVYSSFENGNFKDVQKTLKDFSMSFSKCHKGDK